MVRIVIVHYSRVFIAGILTMLAGQTTITVVGDLTSVDDLLPFLRDVNTDVVLIAEKLSGIAQAITSVTDIYSDLKVLLQIPDYSEELLRKMAEWGAHSVIREAASKEEILQAIVAVNKGEEHLSPDTQNLIRKIYRELSHSLKTKLTKQEEAILNLIVKGMPTKQIATQLNLEESTVKTYRKSLNHKLDAHNATELQNNARSRGLI